MQKRNLNRNHKRNSTHKQHLKLRHSHQMLSRLRNSIRKTLFWKPKNLNKFSLFYLFYLNFIFYFFLEYKSLFEQKKTPKHTCILLSIPPTENNCQDRILTNRPRLVLQLILTCQHLTNQSKLNSNISPPWFCISQKHSEICFIIVTQLLEMLTKFQAKLKFGNRQALCQCISRIFFCSYLIKLDSST